MSDALYRIIKEKRQRLGLTQVEVSAKAGIALPTLQILETGRSNPSIETLEKLGKILGFSVELKIQACNWDRLIELGLPLLAEKPSTRAKNKTKRPHSTVHLATELRAGIEELAQLKGESSTDETSERKKEALSATLLAVSEHYPTYFKREFGRNSEALKLIENPTGRIIKLKRIALSTLCEYL